MPLVFVHGVNVRKGTTEKEQKAYAAEVEARDNLFKTVGLAGLVQPPAKLHIENPYWGEHGVTFSHKLASLPASGAETFGPEPDDAMAQVLTETLTPETAATLAKSGEQSTVLLTLARQDPKTTLPLAVDAIVAAAAHQPADDAAVAAKDSEELARFAASAMAYLRSNPDLKWLSATHPTTGDLRLQDDNQFLDALTREVSKVPGQASGPETFGSSRLVGWLKGTAAALGQAARGTAKAVSSVAKGMVGAALGAVGGAAAAGAPGGGTLVKWVRPWATQRVGVFLGDVLAYQQKRGNRNAPGDIVKIVLGDLREAMTKRTPEDSKLVVICHSMGGNIVYDILTHFDSAIEVDLFVTVGSQVALLKEMGLYMEDRGTATSAGAGDKVPKPAAIKTWLNVFDPLDVLGFAAGAVFDGVTDFAFSTQASALDAHSRYFVRPTFHERLRARMAEVGFGVAP